MVQQVAQGIDDAVVAAADDAFGFLERLVSAPSTVGREAEAQERFAEEMQRLGLDVEVVPVPPSIVTDPLAGVGQASYEGRCNVVARTAAGVPEVLLNGHIDVVPAGEEGWTSSPWSPTTREGWLFGRGAGDMKGGFAMASLAIDALRRSAPHLLEVPFAFLSVIEEECTGNGTLAALRAGITGRSVVLPEPTDLTLLLGGVGIVWVDVHLVGRGGHAEAAGRVERPLDVAVRVIAALGQFGRRLAETHPEPPFDVLEHPYNVNVGVVRAGDWPSSVASEVRLGVRFGHPPSWSADRAVAALDAAIADAVAGSGVTATVRPSGFRAQGHHLEPDDALVRALAAAHAEVHGEPPPAGVVGSTTDARYYLEEAGIPALCYGPVVRNMHGTDEAVELGSIVAGARVLARFLAAVAEKATGERSA